MGDFYFSVNNAAASKEKSLFPPLRCAASSKGKASQWGERPVWEWSGGLRGGGGHPKMYSNTHHADPDLGNIIKYWNRTKNDPDALKKKSRSVALLAQRAVQVSFPLPGTRCSSPSPDQQASSTVLLYPFHHLHISSSPTLHGWRNLLWPPKQQLHGTLNLPHHSAGHLILK